MKGIFLFLWLLVTGFGLLILLFPNPTHPHGYGALVIFGAVMVYLLILIEIAYRPYPTSEKRSQTIAIWLAPAIMLLSAIWMMASVGDTLRTGDIFFQASTGRGAWIGDLLNQLLDGAIGIFGSEAGLVLSILFQLSFGLLAFISSVWVLWCVVTPPCQYDVRHLSLTN